VIASTLRRLAAKLRAPAAAAALARAVLTGVCIAAWVAGSAAWDPQNLQRAARTRGPQVVESVRALQAVLAAADGKDETVKLAAINDFYNRRIVFAPDDEVWGQVDYWASPLEMFEKGRGDCEDFVIGKYFSLIAAGVPSARLRLVYVRAQIGGADGVVQAHMVLAYYAQPNDEPLVLDNLIGEIRPASRRPDLAPVFSFNSDGLWQGTGAQRAGDPVARLSRWREVLAKARAEGFP